MLRLSSLRLQTTLLLLVLLAILPALAVTYYTASERHDHEVVETQRQALGMARTAADSYKEMIQDVQQLLFTLSRLPEVRGDAPGPCNALLRDIRSIHPSYTNIVIANVNGDVWCSALPLPAPLNVADRAYFQRAVQRLDFATGDPQVGRVSGKTGIGFAYPVLDESRQVRGVLAVSLDFTLIEQAASRMTLPQRSVMTIRDAQGTVLVRHPDTGNWVGRVVPEAPVLKTMLAGSGEGIAVLPDIEGRPHLYGFVRLAAAGSEALYVSVGIPEDVAAAEGSESFRRSLVSLVIVGLLALIATWWFANRYVLRPAKALVDATRRLSAGELAARTGLPHTRNEVGELAEAFDHLAESLQHRQAKAEQATQVLRLSEERFRSLIEDASDTIELLSADGTILYVSPNIERLLGYQPDEMVGRKGSDFIHPEDVLAHRYALSAAALKSGDVHRLKVRALHKNGSLHTIECVGKNLLNNPAVGGIVVNLRDVTEQEKAQERIQQQLQTLDNLYANARKLTESLDQRKLIDDVTRTCVETYGARLAWLGTAEPDGSVRVRGSYPGEVDYPRNISVRWDESAEGQGSAGRAIRSGVPSVSLDITTHAGWEPWREMALAQGFTCAASLPLMSQGRPFGVLVLMGDQPRIFTSERLETLQAYAHQAAIALTNAQLFDESRRRLEQVQALRKVDIAITSSLDLRVTLGVALDQVTNVLGVDAAAVLLLNSGTQTLGYAAGRGFRGREIERSLVRVGEGPSGRVALERRIIRINSDKEMHDAFGKAQLIESEAFASYIGAPLIVKGHVKGVLEVFHRTPFRPEGEWLEFLEALAGQVGIAIDEAAMFDDLYRANVDLTLAYDTTLEGWARALELRDYETAGHSRRVSELTTRVARAMGMSDTELAHLRRGTLLHDIGKLSIPDTILLKPGSLTEEEWAVVRRHPTYAYELLSPIPYLRPALDIPYCHHERWDGTGYPRGLKGEQIPLAARIFAIVDVWDALTHERPYKKAWSVEESRAYVRSQSGSQFDPKVAEVFLSLTG